MINPKQRASGTLPTAAFKAQLLALTHRRGFSKADKRDLIYCSGTVHTFILLSATVSDRFAAHEFTYGVRGRRYGE